MKSSSVVGVASLPVLFRCYFWFIVCYFMFLLFLLLFVVLSQGRVDDSDPTGGHDSDSTAAGPGCFSSTRRCFLRSSFDFFGVFTSLLLLCLPVYTSYSVCSFLFYFILFYFSLL